jgi:protoporphyrinogen/coproporphyrinogen III oxidase
MRSGLSIAVVGGGVSGMAAALSLQRAGHEVELIERLGVLGGRCAPGVLGTREVAFGGKNIGRRYTRFRELVAALGDHDFEPFGVNSSRVHNGELVTIDSSRRYRSMRTLMRLGSPSDLARLVWLASRIRSEEANRYLGSPYFTGLGHRSDVTPLASHFGPRLTRSLLRPVTVRMNGAEPEEVFLGTFGTNLGMMMDSFDQLSLGIQPVLRAFAQRVPVRQGVRATRLLLDDGRVVGLGLAGDGGFPEESAYDAVVLAVPAHAAADLLQSTHRELADRLRTVRYFPGTVVLAEYDRPIFTHATRALVFDEGPCSNAGAYGINDRQIVRYTFSGRHARALLEDGTDAEELLAAGEAQLAPYAALEGARRLRIGDRAWQAAYCAYTPFHGDFLAAVHSAVARVPGLKLAGDYLLGASIEACVRSGERAAEQLTGARMARARIDQRGPVDENSTFTLG